jgi:hypothetical protein
MAQGGQPGIRRSLLHHDIWRRGVFAHTSSIYVACGGEWQCFSPEIARYMVILIDGSLTDIRNRSTRYRLGTVAHHHGEPDHQAYLERPFQEAIAEIHWRMHALGLPH